MGASLIRMLGESTGTGYGFPDRGVGAYPPSSGGSRSPCSTKLQ